MNRNAPFAEERRTILLRDAPTRTAIQMVFIGFGVTNYLISNEVMGFLDARLRAGSKDEAIDALCRLNVQRLRWGKENGVFQIQGEPDKRAEAQLNDRIAHMDRTKLVSAFGIEARVAGVLLGGSVPRAILEQRQGREYRHDIVRLLSTVDGGPNNPLTVIAIDAKGVGLANRMGESVRIPVLPLAR